MSKNAEFVSHKKSKQKIDGKPQLPEASMLREGEIAINFAKDVETLSIKNESGDVVTFSSDNYYTEQKLGSGFTGANSGVTVTEAIENIPGSVVDQVIDSGTSASTNAVATKAVYDVITDNELVWTNAYVVMSGAVSSHTSNTNVHITSADRTKLDSITSSFGTMAYESTDSYSSATEVNTALSGKANTATTYTKTEVDARDLWVSGTGVNSVVQKNGQNIASGNYSVAEGKQTSATSESAHAEGKETKASGQYSHTEGGGTTASGQCSHAEGMRTIAGQAASHVEGIETRANGNASHAEGYSTSANGYSSHAEGYFTITNNESEHASGRFNISSSASTDFGDSGNTLFSVGNGTDNNSRHNAFEIRQNGDIYLNDGSMLQTTLNNKLDTTAYTLSVVSAVTVSSDLTNVTCPDSITGASKSGVQAVVIYENGGTTTDYTITVSTSYKSPDGQQISITCAKNGYCEVSYLNINGTIYARGA